MLMYLSIVLAYFVYSCIDGTIRENRSHIWSWNEGGGEARYYEVKARAERMGFPCQYYKLPDFKLKLRDFIEYPLNFCRHPLLYINRDGIAFLLRFIRFALVIFVFTQTGNFIGGLYRKNNAPQTVQTQAQAQMYAYVNADALNVRSSPSAQAEVVTRLNRNDRVQMLETPDASKTWVRIRSGSNEGYVNARFLKQQ
jgi:hypothetical protein